jgi:hypothetical protein
VVIAAFMASCRYVQPPSDAQVAARAELVERLRAALAGNTNAELEKLISEC